MVSIEQLMRDSASAARDRLRAPTGSAPTPKQSPMLAVPSLDTGSDAAVSKIKEGSKGIEISATSDLLQRAQQDMVKMTGQVQNMAKAMGIAYDTQAGAK